MHDVTVVYLHPANGSGRRTLHMSTPRMSNNTAPSQPPTTTTTTTATSDIPEGLYDLLKGVTVAVLHQRPADLYGFVADYFLKVSPQLPSSTRGCTSHSRGPPY